MREHEPTASVTAGDHGPDGVAKAEGVDALLSERYEILERLGEGAVGVVFRAWDRDLRQEVALKVARLSGITGSTLGRMRREAALAREIDHPHVIRIFECFEREPYCVLAMEMLPGGSLQQRLAREGRLSVSDAVGVATALTDGLAALHAHGVIHRDVKPSNILFGSDGGLKLADLGLARRLAVDETRATLLEATLGTPRYMAPEVILGQDPDERADLYGVGVTAFECLTGRLPFGDSLETSIFASIRGRAPDVLRFRPETPRWFARWVARLLERSPNARFADAAEALASLRSRRVPRGLGRAPAWLLAAAGVPLAGLLALLGWGGRISPPPAVVFDHLVRQAPAGIAAVDGLGQELWTIPSIDPGIAQRAIRVRLHPGEAPVLAAILHREGDWSPEAVGRLSFLDPHTGTLVGQAELPSCGTRFHSYPDRYHPAQFVAHDFDHDGVDEVLVDLFQVPNVPSCTVLYEPRAQRGRVLWTASGYHVTEGFADLDGDGRDEVLFSGINNRMGWWNVLAAGRVVPWIGEGFDEQGMWDVRTPDLETGRGLVFYALLRRGNPGQLGMGRFKVNAAARRMTFTFANGPTESVGFNGFAEGISYEASAEERTAARAEAYAHLSETYRLLDAGEGSAALQEASSGGVAAKRAEDARLAEVFATLQARALAAVGRLAEAQRAFQALVAASSSRPETEFVAAEAFHRAGALDRAIAWYRHGLENGGPLFGGGKSRYEFMEGWVFAAVEKGDFASALEATASLERFFPDFAAYLPFYRAFVAWRSGQAPALGGLEDKPGYPDWLRYFSFEARLAAGEPDLDGLLEQVRAALTTAYESRGPLLSLEATLLLRLGRPAEALSPARAAQAWMGARVNLDPGARAFRQVVAGRLVAVESALNR